MRHVKHALVAACQGSAGYDEIIKVGEWGTIDLDGHEWTIERLRHRERPGVFAGHHRPAHVTATLFRVVEEAA